MSQPDSGKSLSLLTDVTLGWKGSPRTNTLAYSVSELDTKIFCKIDVYPTTKFLLTYRGINVLEFLSLLRFLLV
jgi:hypothetical protein